MKIRAEPTIRLLFVLTMLSAPTRKACSQQGPGCEELYGKERFSAIVISLKPILTIRDLDDHRYEIIYQEGSRHKKTVRLYKNRTGQTLRDYLKPGDLIKKLKGEYTITIARRFNNAVDVQQFDLYCEN
jgi:hypothetical protein